VIYGELEKEWTLFYDHIYIYTYTHTRARARAYLLRYASSLFSFFFVYTLPKCLDLLRSFSKSSHNINLHRRRRRRHVVHSSSGVVRQDRSAVFDDIFRESAVGARLLPFDERVDAFSGREGRRRRCNAFKSRFDGARTKDAGGGEDIAARFCRRVAMGPGTTTRRE